MFNLIKSIIFSNLLSFNCKAWSWQPWVSGCASTECISMCVYSVVRACVCACAGSSTGCQGNTLGSRSKVRRVHGAADPHTKWPSTWHWIYRILPLPGLEGTTTLDRPAQDQLGHFVWNTSLSLQIKRCWNLKTKDSPFQLIQCRIVELLPWCDGDLNAGRGRPLLVETWTRARLTRVVVVGPPETLTPS